MSALPAQLTTTEADSNVPISYPDIYVWICNKRLSHVSQLIKTIWDSTPGGDPLQRKTLNDFVKEYGRYLLERFKRYKRKLRTAQQLVPISLFDYTVARLMQRTPGSVD